MKILYNYTSRSRPDNFKRGLMSIIQNSVNEDYCVLISADIDDETMYNNDLIQWVEDNTPKDKVYFRWGFSKSKIDAINRDLNEFLKLYNAEIIINFSDDMLFIQKGFDDVIREAFYKNTMCFDIPETHLYNLDQYLHFNDGNQKSNVCTMHIVGIDYYNRTSCIYNKDYISLWCDVENDIVAKQLGCYKYMGNDLQLFKHLHPAWGLAPQDALSIKTEDRALWVADEITFNKRKKINFGL